MESYGTLLRESREQKNIDIATAERETSISAAYLRALETESHDKFPGKVYLTGFLRTYAEYLGLDAEYLLRLYNAKMKQAEPIPINLLIKRRPRFVVPLIVLGILAVLGVSGFFVYRRLIAAPVEEIPGNDVLETAGSAIHRLTGGEALRTRVYTGDSMIIPGDMLGSTSPAGDVGIDVTNTLTILTLKTPLGEQFISLGEEIEIDVDGKLGADIIVFVSDISRTDGSRGAEIRVLPRNTVATGDGVIPTLPLSQGNTVVLEDNRAYPFTVRIVFRTICMFRHQADNQAKVESLYSPGQLITVQANNIVRIWASNTAAWTTQIIAGGKTYNFDAEKTSRVTARQIRWIVNPRGVYQLTVVEID
ncbi:MAG: helix-turn-helix domain-containing protein [Spirochaetaceae bacterium]|jgi:cytoskeletal protein RodZ|nr:helix-turn-helix domain-containing protein [Spirochaetaceae bacterium]